MRSVGALVMMAAGIETQETPVEDQLAPAAGVVPESTIDLRETFQRLAKAFQR